MIIDSEYTLVEVPRDKMLELRVSEDIEVPLILKKLEPQLHVKIGGDEVVLNYGGGRVEPIPEGVEPVRSTEDLGHIVYLRRVCPREMEQYLEILANYINPKSNVDPSSTWEFVPPLRRTLKD